MRVHYKLLFQGHFPVWACNKKREARKPEDMSHKVKDVTCRRCRRSGSYLLGSS